ncbi:MAG: hypothetical protein ACYTBX_12705 [Planctomycetota bacterium]
MKDILPIITGQFRNLRMDSAVTSMPIDFADFVLLATNLTGEIPATPI